MPDQKKPNILVIWGDDIGISNLSCYSHGVMGYRTPNIDRLAKEGMMFTDSSHRRSGRTSGRADVTSNTYDDWSLHHDYIAFDDALAKMSEAVGGGGH